MEAPMGMGKTEAALYAAYQIASDGHATGIYFALPTQLTSNKIFERFQKFLSQVLADDCSHRSLLLHANAWLFDTDMGEEGQPGGAWFNQSKRGLLAPFAVGTVDQALMAAMNVKHGFVRAFGLAGKVVILDEVHTYDTYTGSLLDDLVSLLRDLQCTVIILSATLNQERREQLLGHPTKSMAYPLVTSSPSLSPSDVIETYVPPSDSRSISVHLSNSDASAMNEALARAGEGQQVLWIENTVKDAQQRFLDLASRCAEIGVGCGLLTSRFTVNDRQNIEAEWVTLFGKSGWGKRSEKGRILIGTQVLEQSIDIDADFMVTRFAPTDMVLQRFGRLWRHEGTPRPVEANPDAWLLAPALESAIEEPQKHFGSSAFVYSPFVLCRSLETWQEVKSINLPQDIRGLIESTYETRQESGPMSQWLRDLDDGSRQRLGRNAMRQLARVALAEGGNTLPEEKASTRYSDSESVDVLMLRSISHDTDKGQIRLILDNGDVVQIALYRSGLNRDQWRKRTAVLMRHVVAVPMGQDPKGLSIRQLRNLGLHHCFYLGDPEQPDQEALLRVVLVDETGCLKSITGGDAHENHQLEYRNDLGYRAIKA
jgi:CRISPR-associated endonuclease/helicase Cas3